MLPGLRTTHDWGSEADLRHVESLRATAARRPVALSHAVLEVLAYAVDEAREGSTTRVHVVLHPDGSVEVADDGRGTDTRLDATGTPVVKPVMATPDLRFFDAAEPPLLDDGLPRRGMSTVTSVCTWLVHHNRRVEGGWSRRYEHGAPVGPPVVVPLDPELGTGTSVRFRPDPALVVGALDVTTASALVAAAPVEVVVSARS